MMNGIWKQTRIFLQFAVLSGVGWLCDFLTFTLLLKLMDLPVSGANFISSYVGVTFVWFASLRAVFQARKDHRKHFLLIYWCFQFLSILAYSKMIHALAMELPYFDWLIWMKVDAEIASKIIITPLNLVTNFIFMKFLTASMKTARLSHD